MRKSRFREEQIIAILNESEAEELCRRHGITRACFYRWKGKFGGMEVSEARRVAGAGRGEPATEAHRGRAGGGHPSIEGGGHKKCMVRRVTASRK